MYPSPRKEEIFAAAPKASETVSRTSFKLWMFLLNESFAT
jgi:hypothetical protein